MKAINVSELKANLSKYLRLASRGARIVVNDRLEPVAELGPPQPSTCPWHERLARQGRLRRGTQDWAKLKVSRSTQKIDTEATLRAVREDPGEERGQSVKSSRKRLRASSSSS
jgi:antitoxin (DNA-binding transcriptional repressor) of toxin-antitoxin stability system